MNKQIMKRLILFAMLLTALSAQAQNSRVDAIRKAYAEAKETIAKHEKNPKEKTHYCGKSEMVSDYMAPGSGPVHEVVRYYHQGIDIGEEGFFPCYPFFITRNYSTGSNTSYEEYLFNDSHELIFYFQKQGDDETRYYWSGGKLVEEKLKGKPLTDNITVLRCAQNFSNTFVRQMNPEGMFLDGADEGDPHDSIYRIIDGEASPDGYVSRYLKEMERQASKEMESNVTFDQYDLVDIDGDGRAEILVRSNEEFPTHAAFAVGSGKPELLLVFDFRGTFVFYQGAVGWQGGCGTGCHMSQYAVVRNSRPGSKYSLLTQYGMDGEELPDECVYLKDDDKNITAAEAEALFKPGGPMGKDTDREVVWQDMLGTAE